MLVAPLSLSLVLFAAPLYPSWSSCCSAPVPAPFCTAWPCSGARRAVVCLAPLGRFPPLLALLSAVPGGSPGSSWALGSARRRAVRGRAGGRWGSRLGPGCSPACSAPGPRPRRDGGRRVCARQGRLSRWSRSCLAARPLLRPIQVSPSARLPAGRERERERAACLSSILAQRAGSCQPRGVPGLPRGSGAVLAASAPGNLPLWWEWAGECGSSWLPHRSQDGAGSAWHT